MSRILFAWELGANYGHVARQLPIARLLREARDEVLFAVRDTRGAEELLAPAGFEFVQAPFTNYAVQVPKPANYAELLLAEDYGNQNALHSRVRAWLTLINLYRPQALVVEHSPTALIAARICALPTLHIGTGFTIPPNVSPLPSIRPWEQVDANRLLKADEHVLACINRCIGSFASNAKLSRLSELLQTEATLLSTFKELDHYAGRDQETYAGPFVGAATTRKYSWQPTSAPKIFSYLRNGTTGLPALIDVLGKCDAQVACVIPGLSASAISRFSTPTMKLLPSAVAMESVLEEADLVICHAGSGVVSESLLAGVPLLMMPTNDEQHLQGSRVRETGAGVLIGEARTKSDLSTAVRELLSNSRYRSNAQSFAALHREFDPAAVISKAANAVRRIIDRGVLH